MSPLGRTLLRLCNTQLQIDVGLIKSFFPHLTENKIKHHARTIGLSIKKDS